MKKIWLCVGLVLLLAGYFGFGAPTGFAQMYPPESYSCYESPYNYCDYYYTPYADPYQQFYYYSVPEFGGRFEQRRERRYDRRFERRERREHEGREYRRY
jgi:hypothetical protein